MSSYKTPEIFTFKAEGDLSGKQYHIAKFGTADDQVDQCGAGEEGIGSIMSKPAGVAGEELEIAGRNGGGLVKVAASIARGTLFKSDADGKAVAVLTRDEALGQIEESATGADQVVACVYF